MPLPTAAADYYRYQQRLSAAVIANARRVWAGMGNDFAASWVGVKPRLTALVTSGQYAAAQAAEPYVERVLAETGQRAPRVRPVNPKAFAGVAADGRALDSMMEGAVVTARTASAGGTWSSEALAAGGRWLDMAVGTAIADAGRGATSVAIAARPAVGGYTRMVNPPACARCVILAGRFYRHSSGFSRHPRCDCVMIPASENYAGDLVTDPQLYFHSLSEKDQNDIFTAAGAKAIRDGADLNQVVNARRGLQVAGARLTTTEGTTKRGYAGKVMRRNGDSQRLMPEAIFQIARDRTEAIDLLRRSGFLL